MARAGARAGGRGRITAAAVLGLGLALLGAAPTRAASDTDYLAMAAVVAALERGDEAGAMAAARQGASPLVDTLAQWLVLRDVNRGLGPSDLGRVQALMATVGDWPQASGFRSRVQSMLATQPGFSATQVAGWFDRHPPTTGQGLQAYADALVAQGQLDRAAQVVRQGWRELDFRTGADVDFLASHGAFLSAADHEARLDRLLDAGTTDGARTLIALLPPGRQPLWRARLALTERTGEGPALAAAVAGDDAADPDLAVDLMLWRYHQGDRQVAEQLMLRGTPVPENRAEDAFKPRHRLIRDAIEAGNWARVYALASTHGAPSGVPFAEGEFYAGWAALRFLNRPAEAFGHFERMFHGVRSDVSRSTAAYWAGRALDAQGDTSAARAWYQRAGAYPGAFYGQMALARLEAPMRLIPGPPLSPDQVAAFEADPRVQAVRLLYAVGQDGLVSSFISVMREGMEDATQMSLLIRLAMDVEQPFWAVRTALGAAFRGLEMGYDGYPVFRIPTLMAPNAPPSDVLHAIMRNESAFNVGIESPAGALGLMQLMPATAQETARRMGVAHQPRRLFTDPNYNIQLGARYLGDRLDDNERALILAAAAYNAGQGNLRKWLGALGNPNTGAVDAIDWIESIPFSETRTYVKKVTASYNVYRALHALLDRS